MFTNLKNFKQKNHYANSWSPWFLTSKWEEQFREALQSMQGLVDLELKMISPERLKEDYFSEMISAKEFYQASVNNATISDANEWRTHAMTIITNKDNNLAWEKQVNKKDKKKFQIFMQAIHLGKDFHQYSSVALIIIIENILPFFHQYLSIAKKEFRFGSWRMPTDVKKEFEQWLTMLELEINRIQMAIAWALLIRLEAGFAAGDTRYDDGIAFIISQFAHLGLVAPKIDLNTKMPLPLLPTYQRHELSEDIYKKVIDFLQIQTDTNIQKQFKKLPLFQERYVKHDIALMPVFRTVNHSCNGKIQAVPENCVYYVPHNTRFIPTQLFPGTHLRATFFHTYAHLIAQLKIPLPDISRLDVLQLDVDSFAKHPKFLQLRQEREFLEKNIHAIQKKYAGLSWYQGKSKTMLQTFLKDLQKRLIQTTEREAKFLAEVSDFLRGDADILTKEALDELVVQLQNMSDAYQQWQKHKDFDKTQVQVRKALANLDSFDQKIEKILSFYQLSMSEMPKTSLSLLTVTDCLNAETKYINNAAGIANNILSMLKEIGNFDGIESAVFLLQAIANKESVFPPLALSVIGKFSQVIMSKTKNQSLQQYLQSLLQIKAQEALCLHTEQSIFHAFYKTLTKAFHSPLPPLLNARLTKLAQEPAQFSYQEKHALFEDIYDLVTTLKARSVEQRAHYQEVLINTTGISEKELLFYNNWKILSEIIIRPEYSILFSVKFSELNKQWRSHLEKTHTVTIEEIYSMVLAIVSALSQAIELHNEQKEILQKIFQTILPHIEALEETYQRLLPNQITHVYQYCQEKHALLKRESLATFALPRAQPTQDKLVDRVMLPELSFDAFKKNLSKIKECKPVTNESLTVAMTTITEQAEKDFTFLLQRILIPQNLLDVEAVDSASFTLTINEMTAISEELIRLGQLIQSWGDQAQKEMIAEGCKHLIVSYCEHWSTENLDPRQDGARRRHHQLSKLQEAIITALSPDLSKLCAKLFTLRVHVMDYKSWFALVDACREYKEYVIEERRKALLDSIANMSERSLQFAAKSVGCVFIEEIKALRNRLVAEHPAKLINLNHINSSMQKLLGLNDASNRSPTTFFQQSSTKLLSKEKQPGVFLETSAALEYLLQQLIKKPPRNLNEIEIAEASMQSILAAIQPTIDNQQFDACEPLATFFTKSENSTEILSAISQKQL